LVFMDPPIGGSVPFERTQSTARGFRRLWYAVPQCKLQAEKMRDRRHNRVPGAAMGCFGMDRGVAARLHSILGLGQSAALMRYRSVPRLRGIVVGKFFVDIEPGGQLTGGRNPLVHRCWLAPRDWTISGRRNGIHVGRPRAALGAAAFDISHRTSACAALGHAQNWLRPPRTCLAGRNCGRAFRRLAIFALRIQYELCVSGSSLSSLLGTCSRASCRSFCWTSRASLLADTPSLELDVSGDWRGQMK
jgi:hypothetical protein